MDAFVMRCINRNMVLVLVAVSAAFVSCSGEAGNDAKTIILAHAMHPTHPVSIAMEKMAESVNETSRGELKVKIFLGGQLGSERELLELIQIGAIGMTKVSAATMENVVPEMQVYSLPYLFRDQDHVLSVLDGPIGTRLLHAGIPSRLRGIAYYDAGSRSIYTVDRRIEHPDDLRGLKIRVMESVISVGLMRTLGGSPTPISWGELYTAFQGGIVDGAENNPPSFYTSRHYEVCRYYILNEHATIPDVLVIDSRLWDRLDTGQQNLLRDAVDASVVFQRELWQEFTSEALATIEESGVELIEPDRQVFIDAVQPLYDRIRTRNPELYRLAQEIREVK